MPANIALAGENTFKVHMRNLKLAYMSRLTRLAPPEMAAENANRTFTVGFNHFVILSSLL